jgi:DNA-binding CsgD family transcriptional regulator
MEASSATLNPLQSHENTRSAWRERLSQATVNFHRGDLYEKLHVQSQRSAILAAKKRGLL